MRFFSRSCDSGLGLGAWRRYDSCIAARQCVYVVLFLPPHKVCENGRVGAAALCAHSRDQRAVPEVLAVPLCRQRPAENPALNIYKSRAGRGETRGLRGPQHWAPGRASRVTPPVQIVGCPARPCRPEGVAPKPKSGLPERPRTRRRPNRGCPAEEQKRRCSSTSPRRSPFPTV